MTDYTDAWLVILGAAVVGTVVLFVLTRKIRNFWLRSVLRWLPPLMLIVPAPVPGYDGQLAPAFVVLLFEGLFQSAGQPGVALAILLASALIVLLGLLWITLRQARRAAADPAGQPDHANSGQTAS